MYRYFILNGVKFFIFIRIESISVSPIIASELINNSTFISGKKMVVWNDFYYIFKQYLSAKNILIYKETVYTDITNDSCNIEKLAHKLDLMERDLENRYLVENIIVFKIN